MRAPRRILFGIGIAFSGFVLSALMRAVGDAPSRQLRGDLPGVGTILATLHLTPDPPKIARRHLTSRHNDCSAGRAWTSEWDLVMAKTGVSASEAKRKRSEAARREPQDGTRRRRCLEDRWSQERA